MNPTFNFSIGIGIIISTYLRKIDKRHVVHPNMESIGINEENIELWVENKNSGSYDLFIFLLGIISERLRVI
jgi:hypothetical protein